MRIMTVVGARPQFIKAAVVSRAADEYNRTDSGKKITEKIIHTGQHYDHNMSQIFFDEMDIPHPEVNLAVGSGRYSEVTGSMMAGLEKLIEADRPDWILVYGDTNSTLAGALAGSTRRIPVAHVEAGLRSFNRIMPEEINRIITDRLSDILFCPSETSRRQLAVEGVPGRAHVVGDVMFDAVLHYRTKAIKPDRFDPFILATVHRAETTHNPDRLQGILQALGRAPLPVVLPLHPGTRNSIKEHGVQIPASVQVLDPLSYFLMLGYIEACSFVVTDSGGLQKEAYFLNKKCLTVRDETEWTELVEQNANRVVGTNPERIEQNFEWALAGPPSAGEIYGRGDAGRRIVDLLVSA